VPIILVWVFVTVLLNATVPKLEKVGEAHSAPMAPVDAPSMKAMMRLGHNFKEFDSNSTVMIVLEGQQPLGPTLTVTTTTSFASCDRIPSISSTSRTSGRPANGGRSPERGRQSLLCDVEPERQPGHDCANESVEAVRKVIDHTPPPPGVKAYVTVPRPSVTIRTSSATKAWPRSRCSPWVRSRSCCCWSTAPSSPL